MTAIEPALDTPLPVRNPWVPMGVLMATTVMVALDATIVNVALTPIGKSLHSGAGIEWVMTAYILAVCASQPATGWLADRFGRKQVLLTCLGAFVAASFLCALATTLPMLLAFRVLQGLGGGAIMPVGMAIAMELFPKERQGRAMASWAIAAMLAPTVGPTVGGWLITALSWHWLFLINLPIGAVALTMGIKVIPQVGHRERRSFDLPGLLLGSGGLSLTVLGVGQGNQWGWRSSATLLALSIGVVLLVLFVLHEQRTPEPLVHLELLAMPLFRYATLTALTINGAQYARVVFMPLELEGLRGYSALRVGLLFALPSAFAALGMGIGGRLVDRIGPRKPIVYGCLGMCLPLLVMSRFTLGTSDWVMVVVMCVQGVAWGISTSPSMVAGLRTLPPQLVAHGTSMRSLATQVSGAVSIAMLGAVVAARAGNRPSPAHAQASFGTVFVVAAGMVLVAMLFAFKLPDHLDFSPAADVGPHIPLE